ncbi:MAG: hypothetical protein ACYTFW_00400 [Planctomycetota bacterium]|jgi:hypothetical protein
MTEPSVRGRWTDDEVKIAKVMYDKGVKYADIASRLGRTVEGVRNKLKRLRLGIEIPHMQDDISETGGVPRTGPIPESPFVSYDEPLVMEGDAIVLPDIELPFHHAEFFNRCLDLADAWGIRKAVVAGDLFHFDSLSSWEANWILSGGNAISEKAERELMDLALTLPAQHQNALISTIVELDDGREQSGTGFSRELAETRTVVKIITKQFDEIDFILGNHEQRFMRAIGSAMFPSELMRLVEAGDKWRAEPYFYSYLISNGEKFQIEHPKTWAKSSPYKLAAKFQCHILQAHSHRWGVDLDPSGNFWAIHMGCIADELKFPYASQRHNTADAHALGAVIVRDGYPYLLSKRTPWERFKKM